MAKLSTKTSGERSLQEIGRRLRLTREALGLKQAEFAGRAGVSRNAYNQYEKGHQRPSLDNAILIATTHKITLDWIYLGDNSSLKYDLVEAMKKLTQLRSSAH